jgi:hypothetical protein
VKRSKKPSAAARTVPLFAEPEHQPVPPKEEKAARPAKAPPSFEGYLIKGGLVETTALKVFVSTGRWPDFFLRMVNGVVPERILRRGLELRRARV